MNRERINEILDMLSSYDIDVVIDELRSLESEEVITSDEYDYILENYDEVVDSLFELTDFRKKIRDKLILLEEIAKDNYKEFEVALMIFLRSNLYQFDNEITNKQLDSLFELTDNISSLLDIEKDDIDNIILNYEDDCEEL